MSIEGMRDIQRSMVREDAWQQLMLVVWIHDRMDRGLIVGVSVSEIRPHCYNSMRAFAFPRQGKLYVAQIQYLSQIESESIAKNKPTILSAMSGLPLTLMCSSLRFVQENSKLIE